MPASDVQRRLEALEVKAAYAEDLLEQLNLTLYRQQQAMDRLQTQVAQLRQQLRDSGGPGEQRDPRDELPPHY
ncbi:MAG: SlyX family protein [Comamonadaceae bacterium]|nr:SlyX family protein [Burkholderiales bacterium]MEB2349416.1 SlyX family protein [Comamonadaceae bacterium]